MNRENIFELADIAELPARLAAINASVRSTGFALLRGLVPRQAMRDCLPAVKAYVASTAALPSSGVSAAQIRRNCLKWSIGGQSSSQAGIARLMLTLMNPMYEEDLFGLRATFSQLIMVRDTLARRPGYLFDEALSAPLFNGTRLQIYPTGGGFMTAHTDTRAVSNVQSLSADYIQLVLLMTEKGQDYTSGGAFVEKDGQRIDSEAHSQSGDILVYDGNTLHGVADIDTHLAFAPGQANGRIVALATIYN